MPFVRYDVGDLGHLDTQCPCGHDAPTLSAIYGRGKNLISKADGSLHPFHVRVGNHPGLPAIRSTGFMPDRDRQNFG